MKPRPRPLIFSLLIAILSFFPAFASNIEEVPTDTIALLREMAEAGDGDACVALGALYENGIGVALTITRP